jgi:hypothetical protein
VVIEKTDGFSGSDLPAKRAQRGRLPSFLYILWRDISGERFALEADGGEASGFGGAH